MIELAPHHKIGLLLNNPVLIASGFGGYGNAYQQLIDVSTFGAIVTNPITLRPRRGLPQPRVAETKAGFILNTGQQNPGVKQVIRQYSKVWIRLGVPVIAHLPADEPDDLRRTARALTGTETIAAIELGLPPDATAGEIEHWIKAVREGSELPLLVKLPLKWAAELAEMVATTAADTLVITASPIGAAYPPQSGEMVRGNLYSPALHSLVLGAVQAVRELVELPLIAAGGIHSVVDARAFLDAGVMAVQVDSLLLVDPQAAYDIARVFYI